MLETKTAPFTFVKQGIFYFSRRVPKDLSHHYNASRIMYSLRTRSKVIATSRAQRAAQALDEHWYHLRIRDVDLPGKHLLRTQAQSQSGLPFVAEGVQPSSIGHVTAFAKEYVKLPNPDGRMYFDFGLMSFKVETHSIPEIMRLNDIEPSRLAAIKLDIEGHEGPVLKGALECLQSYRPMLMNEGANRSAQVREIMYSLGYLHYELREGALRSVSEVSAAQDGYWIHPDRAAEYRRRGLKIE